MIESSNNSIKIIIAFLTVASLVLIIYSLSGGECLKSCKKTKEPYVQEFSGNNVSCTNNYRLNMNSTEDTSRNRCKFCKGYSKSYETFQNCPHNCRQYGVASCDQGKMM
jgi:hypothetical protein